MANWNKNLIHSQLFGLSGPASYTLDFYADSVSKRIITMNVLVNYNGQEYTLENVINNNQNNLYGMLVATGIDVPVAANLVGDIMQKLWNQRFVSPKVVV